MEHEYRGVREAPKDAGSEPIDPFHKPFHQSGTMEHERGAFRRQGGLIHHMGIHRVVLAYVRDCYWRRLSIRFGP